MEKKIKFGFFTLKAIHKTKMQQERNIKKLFESIEEKPLNLYEKNHRYISLPNNMLGTISSLNFFSNGIFLKLRKCKPQDIQGSFLGKGEEDYDVVKELNDRFNRNDSTTIEENFIKIFDDDIAILQLNRNAITANQLYTLLSNYFKDYQFEIAPIYRNDLFEEIEKGRVKHLNISVGFSPYGSKFNSEYYNGIANIEVCFKKMRGKKYSFLNPFFIKDILQNRKTTGLGAIDHGCVKTGKLLLDEKSDFIKLDCYQLQEEKSLAQGISLEELCTNELFDNLKKKHINFLSEYLERDTRY